MILALAGVGTILAAGLYGLAKAIQEFPNAVHTEGTVVKLKMSSKGATTPIVEYQVGGKVYQFQGREKSTWPWNYSVGEKVAVLYQPDNPEAAIIDSWGRWLIPVALTVGGLFALVVIVAGARRKWIWKDGKWRKSSE
jgi:hypothetical protein